MFGKQKIDVGLTPYPASPGAMSLELTFDEFMRNITAFEHEHERSEVVDVNTRELPLYAFLKPFQGDQNKIAADELGVGNRDFVYGLNLYHIQLFVGPAGSGVPPHYHRPTLNYQTSGSKRWQLMAPADSIYSVKPSAAWQEEFRSGPNRSQVFECTQRAGDVLYLPQMWTHATVNNELSIGVALTYEHYLMVNPRYYACYVNLTPHVVHNCAARTLVSTGRVREKIYGEISTCA